MLSYAAVTSKSWNFSGSARQGFISHSKPEVGWEPPGSCLTPKPWLSEPCCFQLPPLTWGKETAGPGTEVASSHCCPHPQLSLQIPSKLQRRPEDTAFPRAQREDVLGKTCRGPTTNAEWRPHVQTRQHRAVLNVCSQRMLNVRTSSHHLMVSKQGSHDNTCRQCITWGHAFMHVCVHVCKHLTPRVNNKVISILK